MDAEMNLQEIETPLPADEVKLWSVLAQLSFFVGYMIPFGGLIAAVLIFKTFGKKNPIVKKNAKAALNLAISNLLISILAFSVGLFLTQNYIFNFEILFGLFGLVFAYGAYGVISSILNALAVRRGEIANYTLAFEVFPLNDF